MFRDALAGRENSPRLLDIAQIAANQIRAGQLPQPVSNTPA
jgi:hypothetical protein